MKLIVCFGSVKVIVPCGDGKLSVKDFIEKATARYMKASQRESFDEIDVKYLQTEDDAILDHDDIIHDVCDDKEKLIAIFDKKSNSFAERNDDVTSESSNISLPLNQTYSSIHGLPAYGMERVTPPQDVLKLEANMPFQNIKKDPTNEERFGLKKNQRDPRREPPWKTTSQSLYSSSTSSTPMSSPDASKDTLGFNAFDRNSNRKSLSVGHPLLYSWIDAQEKMAHKSQSPDEEIPYDKQDSTKMHFRSGQDASSTASVGDFDDIDDISSTTSEEIELEARLREDFGLRVQGYKNADGKELGLIVHEIKNDSIMGKNGSLNVADRITEVNGVNLREKTNSEAESILNEALSEGNLRLKRTRSHHFIRASLRDDFSSQKVLNLPRVPETAIINSKEAPRVKAPLEAMDSREAPIEDPKNVTSIQKPAYGKRIAIELKKGSTGLGFSITSRDVVTNVQNPVYVKNILPKGAAIQDGRLKVGDQITEIDGVDVRRKDQTEIVNILKKASGLVKLVVYRQQSQDLGDMDENEDAMETISNDSGISTVKEEILSMTIPLNDLGSAGLGISVKGKSQEKCDLGIFVKSVIKGGAASKDGRLRAEDRLLQINDIALDGISNEKAMEAMRNALIESVRKGSIKIVVSRKAKNEVAASIPDGRPAMQTGSQGVLPSSNLAGVDACDFQSNLRPKIPTKNENRLKTLGTSNELKSSTHGAVKFVSVSSSEIPITPPSKTVIIERATNAESKHPQLVEVKSIVFPRENEFFFQTKPEAVLQTRRSEDFNTAASTELSHTPPSYQETLKRRSLSSSDTSSNVGSFKNSRKPLDPLNSSKGYNGAEDFSNGMDLLRTISTSSRYSIDSLMLSPDAMPFERDAFGRLSMSERKGRAHLDATRSDFYSKLKKSKSLENVHSIKHGVSTTPKSQSKPPAAPDSDTEIVPFHEAIRRTESLDTLLNNSHVIPDDEDAFQRNTTFSKSTPWYAQRTMSPTALKLRSRSAALNDSFRIAVDKTQVFYTQKSSNDTSLRPMEGTIPLRLTSNANYTENQSSRKKSGILKGIGNLLKKGKSRKADEKVENKGASQGSTTVEKLIDFPRTKRPHSLHEETISHRRGETNSSDVVNSLEREIQHAKKQKEEKLIVLQKELLTVQKEEMKVSGNILDRNERLIAANGDISKKQFHRVDADSVQPNVRKSQNPTKEKPGGHKSLLQRGQERIQMREKKQISNLYKTHETEGGLLEDGLSAVESEMTRRPVSEFRESQRKLTSREQTSRDQTSRDQTSTVVNKSSVSSVPHVGVELTTESNVNDRRDNDLESRTETTSSWLDSKEWSEDDAISKQRFLSSKQLFYYGHSSLPRKFTMDDLREKSSFERKQPSRTIEEQTDAFKRARHSQNEVEMRSSKRGVVQRRTQMQNNLTSNVGNITISHAANI